MPLAKEDIDFIKAQFEAWLTEMLPEQKPGVYDLELRTRMLKVEEELRHQRELMQQGFAMMEKRFDQVDKWFEQVDKRFEQVEKRFEQVDKRFESMQHNMDKRFEQVERRFEQMDKRFDVLTVRIDRFMRWSFGLTLTVAGIIIAVLKFT
jgi:DNA anti-recombination protein RmuC